MFVKKKKSYAGYQILHYFMVYSFDVKGQLKKD